MRKFLVILCMCVMTCGCLSTATAQESGYSEEASYVGQEQSGYSSEGGYAGQDQNGNSSEGSGYSGDPVSDNNLIPGYMRHPVNGRYPDNVRLGAAKAGAILGWVATGINLILGTASISLKLNDRLVPPFSIGNTAFLVTAIFGPVVNAMAESTHAWQLHPNSRGLNAASWVWYAGSWLMEGLTIALFAVDRYYFYTDYFCAINFLFTTVSMAFFACKALFAHKIARHALDYNARHGGAQPEARRHIKLAPSVAPVMSARNELIGGTLGLSGTF